MAFYVRMGSTDPPGPSRTFDRVDDEELAVEMVRVIETWRPTAWATILSTTPRPGGELRSHPELVGEAEHEYDARDANVQAQADEIRTEALRRLGRLQEDEPDATDLEPERTRGNHRLRGALGRRRSKRQPDVPAAEPVEVDASEEIPVVVRVVAAPAPVLEHEPIESQPASSEPDLEPEHADPEEAASDELSRVRTKRKFRLVGKRDEQPADLGDASPTAEELDPGTQAPAVPAVEGTTHDVEQPGDPPRSPRRLRGRRRAERQEPLPAESEVETPIESAESSKADSGISERIAGYAYAYERRSVGDRRLGVDRRQVQVERVPDRRSGGERRSGFNRRKIRAG